MTKYTMEDLRKIQDRMEVVYQKMFELVNVPGKNKYTKEYDELELKEVAALKQLNQYVYDPCPINTSCVSCDKCTGIINNRVKKNNKNGYSKIQCFEDRKRTKGWRFCNLRKYNVGRFNTIKENQNEDQRTKV